MARHARVFLSVMVGALVCLAADGRPEAGAVSSHPEPDWSAVLGVIRESEYHISWQPSAVLEDGLSAAWHAPNRAHGFRTYFLPEGIHLVPRAEEPPSWQLGLRVAGWGGEVPPAPPEPRVSVEANRIDYDRATIIERYINGPLGLDQLFVLLAPPDRGGAEQARSSGSPALALAFGGGLSPAPITGGRAIDFATARGVRMLRWSLIAARDVGGRDLPARVECFNAGEMRGLRVILDERDAAYPLAIEVRITSAVWTAQGDQVDAAFGAALAAAGDVNGDGYSDIIVGVPGFDNGQSGEGRALLFPGSASGPALAPAWTAEGDQAGAAFGSAVATAGDVNGDGFGDVIVGAPSFDNGQTDEGRAFVYHGSVAGLTTSAIWTAEGDQAGAAFGSAVAAAADVDGDGYGDVIVGAPAFDNGEADEGRAFSYRGSSGGLASAFSWTAESNQANAAFAAAVGGAGDTDGDGHPDVIVGAPSFDNGQTDEGRAFLYRGSAGGLSPGSSWSAEGDQSGAAFGAAAGTAGDVDGDGYADLVIGAPLYDNGQDNEGAALLYRGSATGPAPAASWTAEIDQAAAQLGASAGTAGDVDGDGYADLVIGAPLHDNGQTDEGRVLVYRGSPAGPSTNPTRAEESDQVGAHLGRAAAAAGDVNGDGFADLIAGAPAFDGGESDEGAAFTYAGSPNPIAAAPAWTAQGEQAAAFFGFSVASAGDVNGDGFSDVIVGAQDYDNGEMDEGAAFLFYGSPVGLAATPGWTAEGNQAEGKFGYSVAAAGDVNGDGYGDVIVGAYRFDNLQFDEGRASVFHGSPAGLGATPVWTAESNQFIGWFAYSVASAGDVNGDGYGDVIIGSILFDNDQQDEGRAFAYHGSASGLATSANWTAELDQDFGSYGAAVAGAGDVNGDGYGDVIVGAYLHDNGQTDEGRALLYRGTPSGLSTSFNWSVEGNKPNTLLGVSLASAGDVNGDGYSDVIIGANGFDNGETDEGQARVYNGSATGLSLTPSWRVEPDQDGARFGVSVASAGDVNGDGYSDVIVGANQFDNGEPDEGAAFVYLGSAAGLGTSPSWEAEGGQVGAGFGLRVAGTGDVNGDGYADVLAGAWLFDGVDVDEGRALLFLGNDGPGLSLRPQQRRVDSNAPVAPLGASDRADRFRVGVVGRTPFGRGRVRLEWEAKPLGVPLDGSGIQSAASWTDSGVAGAALDGSVTGLLPQTPQHWRLRLRYNPATTPFQQASRWLAMPWNGRQEADLRTAAPPAAGRVPVGALVLSKTGGPGITLSWGASCLTTDTDYSVYEGALGNFTSHVPKLCSSGGITTATFTPAADDRYYLIVPHNSFFEGSYGAASSGTARPPSSLACRPQQTVACPPLP